MATIRLDNEDTEEIEIMSPLLFNIYSEAMISKALEDLEAGAKINGTVINNLCYADDKFSSHLPNAIYKKLYKSQREQPES